MKNKYIEKENNRLKSLFRIKLGFSQFIRNPILNLIWLPVMAILFAFWSLKEYTLSIVIIPPLLSIPLHYAVIFLDIILPILVVLCILTAIAEIAAQKDEAALICAFSKSELSHGHPILVKKQKGEANDVTEREFYSNIPLYIWEKKTPDIADIMSINLVEPIKYANGNGKRVLLISTPGRNKPQRGTLYDE